MTDQPNYDRFTFPGAIPDASDPCWHQPRRARIAPSADAANPAAPSATNEDWRERGLKHPAGRGWQADGGAARSLSASGPGAPSDEDPEAKFQRIAREHGMRVRPPAGDLPWPKNWLPGDDPVPAQSIRDADPYEDVRKFDMAARVTFLDLLASCGEVRTAAAVAGVSRETVYRARRRFPEFARLWDAARIHSRARAEAVLATNALDGVEVPVFLRGEHVATYRRHDARYLLAHLARLDKFAEANPRAEADAERFEDMLAAMAGSELPEGFAEAADEAGGCDGGEIVPTRAQYLAWSRSEARLDVLDAREEAEEGAAIVPVSPEELAEKLAAREAEECAAMDEAAEDAAELFDWWQAENRALIDRMTGWVSEEDAELAEEDAAPEEEAPEEAPEAEAETPGTVCHVSTPPKATSRHSRESGNPVGSKEPKTATGSPRARG